MRLVNLTPHLKAQHRFEAFQCSFNGCSGYYHTFSPTDLKPGPFLESEHLSVWDALVDPTSLYKVAKYSNRRLSIVFLPTGHRVPNPSRFYKPPEDYKAWYLRKNGKLTAILGTFRPAMFTDPQSPPLVAISDPAKYLSMRHLMDNGYFNVNLGNRRVRDAEDEGGVRSGCSARLTGAGQIMFDSYYYDIIGGGSPIDAWSKEYTWISGLPWWERYRLSEAPYCTAKDMVKATADTFYNKYSDTRLGGSNGLAWICGCMRLDGPTDSVRGIFSLYSLDPEKSADLSAPQYVMHGRKRMYYKVLPFYFHSPQHQNHRCAAAFLSTKPLTFEPVNV